MTKSDELVRDFYKGQAKKYKTLVVFLVIIILLNIVGLFYLRSEQRTSNDRLEDIGHTLTTYVKGTDARIDERNRLLQEQHDKLYKAIVCLVALHDAEQLSEEAESECRQAAEEVHNMDSTIISPEASPQSSTTAPQEPSNSPPAPTPTNPQPDSPGPLQSLWQMVTQPVDDLINLIRG